MTTGTVVVFWVGYVLGYYVALYDTGKIMDRLRERWRKERP